MTGKLSRNFHGVGIGSLSKILAVNKSNQLYEENTVIISQNIHLVHVFNAISNWSSNGLFLFSANCLDILIRGNYISVAKRRPRFLHFLFFSAVIFVSDSSSGRGHNYKKRTSTWRSTRSLAKFLSQCGHLTKTSLCGGGFVST